MNAGMSEKEEDNAYQRESEITLWKHDTEDAKQKDAQCVVSTHDGILVEREITEHEQKSLDAAER
jgi:hypothetical protein